jgi:hypothetical protein
MLAITWVNEFNVNNGFAASYSGAEQFARDLVNRAIDDWEAVITDFNYDGDNNPATMATTILQPIIRTT